MEKADNLPILLTTEEVADWLRVSEVTIRKWARSGLLPSRTIPYGTRPRYRFMRADVLEFAERMRTDQHSDTPPQEGTHK